MTPPRQEEAPPPRRRVREPRPTWALAVVLGFLVYGLYAFGDGGVGGHAFVDFDDHQYVVENARLDGRLGLDDLRSAFEETTASNWAPATSLSIAISDALHGPDPGAYAKTNAALHALASGLLFLALRRLTGRWLASLWVAALFGVHPLHVESVAWISQRKDVLAGVFWIASLLAYAHSSAVSDAERFGRATRTSRLAPSVVVFGTLAMLSKATAVVLPISLLLLDYWPLAQLRSRRELVRATLEKWPLIVVAATVSLATLIAQSNSGAQISSIIPVGTRLLNAGHSVWIYIAQSFWPVGLAAYYPYPTESDLLEPAILARIAGVALVSIVALSLGRRAPHLTMGWAWFLVTLLPMIGLVQVGGQAHADRYVYLAQTGLAIMLAFAASQGLERRPPIRDRDRAGGDERVAALRIAVASIAVASVIVLAWLTRSQIAVWKDSTSLYRHATQVTRENHFAHRFLGVALWNQGRTREAEAEFLEALRIRPTWGDAHLVLATAYLQQGRLDEASAHLDRARENGADAARVWAARGILAGERGDETEAARAYEQSLSLDPDDWEVANNLAWIRASSRSPDLRDPKQALVLSQRALQERPADPWVLGTRAGALAAAGHTREAVGVQQQALARLAEPDMRAHRPAFEARLAHYRSGGTPSDFRWPPEEGRSPGPPAP